MDLTLGPLCGHASPGLAWFRLFGVGLHVKDTRRHPLLFSEREGRARRLPLGPWSVRALPRWR